MKNKDIYSALIGSGFFALPYLALSAPLAPSLLIGAAAFAAGELVFSNKKIKGFSKSINEIISDAKNNNKKILDAKKSIKDEKVKEYLDEINIIIDKIIIEIKENNNKIYKLDNFFEYYIPVTVKIANKYKDIESNKINSKDSKEFLEDSKKMLYDAKNAYNKILSSLYEKELIDLDAEMKVFNSMIKSDGIVSEDFNVNEGGKDE